MLNQGERLPGAKSRRLVLPVAAAVPASPSMPTSIAAERCAGILEQAARSGKLDLTQEQVAVTDLKHARAPAVITGSVRRAAVSFLGRVVAEHHAVEHGAICGSTSQRMGAVSRSGRSTSSVPKILAKNGSERHHSKRTRVARETAQTCRCGRMPPRGNVSFRPRSSLAATIGRYGNYRPLSIIQRLGGGRHACLSVRPTGYAVKHFTPSERRRKREIRRKRLSAGGLETDV